MQHTHEFNLYANPLKWKIIFERIANGTLSPNACNDHVMKNTLMHEAAHYPDAAIMRQLLAMGANPSAENAYGDRPMHWAVGNFHGNALHMLEKCRMLPVEDLAARNYKNQTPLFMFIDSYAHFTCYGSFDDYPENVKPFLRVLASMLEQCHCDPEARDNTNRTPLEDLDENYSISECGEAVAMITAAIAARKRWTAARATWLAACSF